MLGGMLGAPSRGESTANNITRHSLLALPCATAQISTEYQPQAGSAMVIRYVPDRDPSSRPLNTPNPRLIMLTSSRCATGGIIRRCRRFLGCCVDVWTSSFGLRSACALPAPFFPSAGSRSPLWQQEPYLMRLLLQQKRPNGRRVCWEKTHPF